MRPCFIKPYFRALVLGEGFETEFYEIVDKKKPKTLQSWAKSTKGGGWRRQPWQADHRIPQGLSPHLTGICRGGLPHPQPKSNIHEKNLKAVFCAMQDL